MSTNYINKQVSKTQIQTNKMYKDSQCQEFQVQNILSLKSGQANSQFVAEEISWTISACFGCACSFLTHNSNCKQQDFQGH